MMAESGPETVLPLSRIGKLLGLLSDCQFARQFVN